MPASVYARKPENPNYFGPALTSTTNIDKSDNSTSNVSVETMAAPTETVGNVTCGGVTLGFDTIKQEKDDAAGVFRIAYSPPTQTCKKAASLQAENIRMQNLREVGQTILLCKQLKEVGASSDSDDQAIKDLMAFCQ
jgi:hypothetical protein